MERHLAAVPLSVAFALPHDQASGEGGVLSTEQLILQATTVATAALSVGYAIWLLRGGSLFASMLATLPAWSRFDPLPILDSCSDSDKDERNADSRKAEDEERLQDIADK